MYLTDQKVSKLSFRMFLDFQILLQSGFGLLKHKLEIGHKLIKNKYF